MDKTPAWERTPAGQQWIMQQDKQRRVEREASLAANAKDRADLDAKTSALKTKLDQAAAAETRARTALRAAIAEHERAATEMFTEVNAVDHRCARRELTLRLAVPEETQKLLDDFCDEMEKLWSKQRRGAFHSEARPTGRWVVFQNRGEVEYWNNSASLRAQLTAVKECQRAAREVLTLEADVSPGAISVKLDQLRGAIPALRLEKVAVGDAA